MIGFNRRFDPSFKALRDRIQGGELGRLEQVVITSRDPAPPPAQYVKGSGDDPSAPQGQQANGTENLNPSVEDAKDPEA